MKKFISESVFISVFWYSYNYHLMVNFFFFRLPQDKESNNWGTCQATMIIIIVSFFIGYPPFLLDIYLKKRVLEIHYS